MPYITLPALSANKVLTASYLNDVNANLRIISGHDHSGSAGEGSASVTSSSAASPFIYRQEIIAHIAPSQSNWNTTNQNSAYIFGAQKSKTTGNAASLTFPISLIAGTYSLAVMFDDSISSGSTRIFIGSTSIASIGNQGVASLNSVCVFNDISIANSASAGLQFNTAANTNWRLSAFKIRRTGN